MTTVERRPLRIGIVGYGTLGKFLAHKILDRAAKCEGGDDSTHEDDMELAFVWNRSSDKVRTDPRIPADVVVEELAQVWETSTMDKWKADLIVEVAHPQVCIQYASNLITVADVLVGSPNAFADHDLDELVRRCSLGKRAPDALKHGLFVPSGALWGAQDIRKMALNGSLKGLTVTMKKHPSSFRVAESLDKIVKANWDTPGETVLYDGPLRPLCALAPTNVNTMACAALASGTALGFDRVHAFLVSDPSLEAHVIEIEVMGPDSAAPLVNDAETNGKSQGDEHVQKKARLDGSAKALDILMPSDTCFSVRTVRFNPARKNQVTGSATYLSFWSSVKDACERGGRGPGMFLC